MDKWTSLLKSRRFWVSVIGLVTIITSDVFGVDLKQEHLLSLVTIISAWVIGDTIRETK